MSSDKEQQVNNTRGSLRLAPACSEVEEQKAKLPRQFVNFTFYHARPEWRLLFERRQSNAVATSLLKQSTSFAVRC